MRLYIMDQLDKNIDVIITNGGTGITGKDVPFIIWFTFHWPAITCSAVADGKSDPNINLCSTPYSIAVLIEW